MFRSSEDDESLSDYTESLSHRTKATPSAKSGFLKYLRPLFEEFETLGLCDLKGDIDWEDETIYTDLVIHAHKLVNLHRKSLVQQQENNATVVKLKSEISRLDKQVEGCQKAVDRNEGVIDELKHKLKVSEISCRDLQREKRDLESQLRGHKKTVDDKGEQLEHKIKMLKAENERLKGLTEKSIGTFVANDEVLASVIQKYKTNEHHYKKTIKKINENHQTLIKQLLELVVCKENQSVATQSS